MKKVLIHTLIFGPDGVSTAYLYNDIALRFQREGYEVVVLTTTPHFNIVEEQIAQQPLHWKIWGLCKESSLNGIKVYHIPQKKFHSTLLRVLGFVYWHIVSFLTALFIRNVDVILAPSPPLTVGAVSVLLGKLKRCKVIYNVQEIYPDILKLKPGLVHSTLSKLERFVYNHSDAVCTIDDIFYNTILPRFKDQKKVHIIPNFVDTEVYKPVEWKGVLNPQLFPQTSGIRLLYAGNVGYAQDWEPLVQLAEKTRHEDVDYFIVGEGVMKAKLAEEVEIRQLTRVHILPYQPREMMPAIIAYSDLQFIFMNPKMEREGFPSKVYTIMACGKPLLIGSGKDTPLYNFLSDKGCAKIVGGTSAEEKADAMAQWLKCVSKKELMQMGLQGQTIIQGHYTKEIVTKQYVDLALSLI